MFFLPSGRRVERHVLHGLASGGAVKQSTCGRLEEVPVPRKMSSTGSSGKGATISREPMNIVARWRGASGMQVALQELRTAAISGLGFYMLQCAQCRHKTDSRRSDRPL